MIQEKHPLTFDYEAYLKQKNRSLNISYNEANVEFIQKEAHHGRQLYGTRLGAVLRTIGNRLSNNNNLRLLQGDAHRIADFIGNWISEQSPDEINHLFHNENIEEFYKEFWLPFCPRGHNYHSKPETVKDNEGRTRCAYTHTYPLTHRSQKIIVSREYDSLSELEKIKYEAYINGEENFPEHKNKKQNMRIITLTPEEQKNGIEITDTCYAILPEQKVMSLEQVLNNLRKHKTIEPNILLIDIDSWALSAFVWKWYNQTPKQDAPVFEK